MIVSDLFLGSQILMLQSSEALQSKGGPLRAGWIEFTNEEWPVEQKEKEMII